MPKKTLTLLLAVLLLLSLAACAKTQDGSDTPTGAKTAEDQTQTPDPSTPAERSGQILYADTDYQVTLTDMDTDSLWGTVVYLRIENMTDEEISLFADRLYVNNYQLTPLLGVNVGAGQTADTELVIHASDLETCGITLIDALELTFTVRDAQSLETRLTFSAACYPNGETAEPTPRSVRESDVILVDNEAVTVILTGARPDAVWGYEVDLYVHNRGSSELTLRLENTTVNGISIIPQWTLVLPGGRQACTSLYFTQESLDANGIPEVTEILADLIFSGEDIQQTQSVAIRP